MVLRVSGKNLDIGPALRLRAQDEIITAVGKYFDGAYNGHLTVEKEGTGFRTECTLHLATGRSVCVSSMAHDPHASLGQVIERITKQLRRLKREKKGRTAADAFVVEAQPAANGHATSMPIDEEDEPVAKAAAPIVAETMEVLERLGVPDAADRMEQDGLSSLIFRNRGTGRVNVMRRREDGSIGWIDIPERHRTV